MTTAEREAIDLRLELAFTRVDMIELGRDVMSYRACFISTMDVLHEQATTIDTLRRCLSNSNRQIAQMLGVREEDPSDDESE